MIPKVSFLDYNCIPYFYINKRIQFEGRWQKMQSYTQIPNEKYYFDKFTFIKKPNFMKILAIENQNQKIQFGNSSGKIFISFRPFKQNTKSYSSLIELKTNKDISTKLDKPKYSYYDEQKENKFIMTMKVYDDEYEDQHHIISSLVVNLRTVKKQKVNTNKNPIEFIDGLIDSISQDILFNTLNFNTVSTFTKYHCQLQGQFFFNSNLIMEKKNKKVIQFDQLMNADNVFSINLNSKDSYCDLNIKAELKMKQDNTGLMGLLYYLYVAFFCLLIIRSGFKLIFESLRNREINKKMSLFMMCFVSLLDFFFIFDFFATGRLVII